MTHGSWANVAGIGTGLEGDYVNGMYLGELLGRTSASLPAWLTTAYMPVTCSRPRTALTRRNGRFEVDENGDVYLNGVAQ